MKHLNYSHNLVLNKGKVVPQTRKRTASDVEESMLKQMTAMSLRINTGNRERNQDGPGIQKFRADGNQKINRKLVISNGLEEFQNIRKETDERLRHCFDVNNNVISGHFNLGEFRSVCEDCQKARLTGHVFPRTEGLPSFRDSNSEPPHKLVPAPLNHYSDPRPMHLTNVASGSDSEGYNSSSGTDSEGNSSDRWMVGRSVKEESKHKLVNKETTLPVNLSLTSTTKRSASDQEKIPAKITKRRRETTGGRIESAYASSNSDELNEEFAEPMETPLGDDEEAMTRSEPETFADYLKSMDANGHASWIAQILEPTRAPGYYTREFTQLVKDYSTIHGLNTEVDDDQVSLGVNSRASCRRTSASAANRKSRHLSALTYESDLDSSFASASVRLRKLSTASNLSEVFEADDLEVRKLGGSLERLHLVPF